MEAPPLPGASPTTSLGTHPCTLLTVGVLGAPLPPSLCLCCFFQNVLPRLFPRGSSSGHVLFSWLLLASLTKSSLLTLRLSQNPQCAVVTPITAVHPEQGVREFDPSVAWPRAPRGREAGCRAHRRTRGLAESWCSEVSREWRG